MAARLSQELNISGKLYHYVCNHELKSVTFDSPVKAKDLLKDYIDILTAFAAHQKAAEDMRNLVKECFLEN